MPSGPVQLAVRALFLYPFHTEVQNTKEENRIEFFPIDQ